MNDQSIQLLQSDMKDMKGKVDKMYFALMGNELARDGGLVGRIEHLEQQVEGMEGNIQKLSEKNVRLTIYQQIMWTALGIAAGAIFMYFFQTITK